MSLSRTVRRQGRVTGLLLVLAAAPALAAKADGNVFPAQPVVIPASDVVALQLPVQDPVVFRGVVSLDKAGVNQTQFLYPAPDAVTGLAGVLAHALVSKSMRDGQKSAMQKEADLVLEPFREHLDGYLAGELQQRTLAQLASHQPRIVASGDGTAGGWVVQSLPVFALTQDRRALVLDNTITVFAAADLTKPLYRNTVRVVSAPVEAADLEAHWKADKAEPFRRLTASLEAESVTMVLGDLGRAGSASPAARTVRYPEGGVDRMERASVLVEGCDRLVIRSLRGWLMAVPRKDPQPCAAAPATAAN